ncbi:MAG: SDR family oxidoreductase [Deinococcota bacterium]
MSVSYAGTTALVTGASSGIGYAFAVELAKRGCNLVLVARSQDKLESLAAHLRQTYSTDVLIVCQDLSLEDAATNVFTQTQQAGKHIHLLVNNAGFGDDKPFVDVAFEAQQAMINLNVQTVSNLTHLYLPEMLKQRAGGIINLASIISFTPFPYMTVYAATKAFVLNFSQGLWAECQQQGVHVLAMCPGNTATGFFTDMDIADDELSSMDTTHHVVNIALDALYKNQSYVITNWRFRLLLRLIRFVPREIMVRLLGRLNTPR